ncbi:MAG: cupin-like domain-containing protein [Gammaproteobacteria bacterium]
MTHKPHSWAASSDPVASSPQESRQVLPTAVPVLSLAKDGAAAIRQAVASGKPAVFADLAESWPALTTWSPSALSERFGGKRVRVYDASFGTPGKNYMGSVDEMDFAQFLNAVLNRGRDLRMFLYNISQQIPELLDDVRFPDVGLRFSRRFVFTFFGCQGATTPLHYDIDMGHVLHTVIRGRRRIRLYAPSESAALYRHPFTVRSYLDLDSPDTQAYPAFAHAQGYELELLAGQTLFMPAGYWHEFHYLEAGIGLSLRAPSPRLRDRATGVANLLLLSPVDRCMNKIATKTWFDWKRRRALTNARAFIKRKSVL